MEGPPTRDVVMRAGYRFDQNRAPLTGCSEWDGSTSLSP